MVKHEGSGHAATDNRCKAYWSWQRICSGDNLMVAVHPHSPHISLPSERGAPSLQRLCHKAQTFPKHPPLCLASFSQTAVQEESCIIAW